MRLLELTRLLPGALMGAPVSPPPHGAGTVGSLVCCCFSVFFGVFGFFAGFSGFCGLIWVSLVFVVFSVFRGPQAGSNSRPVGMSESTVECSDQLSYLTSPWEVD